MAQRYDCKGAVVTHDAGPFVLYEDYAALENLLIAVVAGVGPCDIPDHLFDALCKAGVLE